MHNEVLIIEDDKDIRETLGELLQSEGFSVRLAEDGEEALSMLKMGVLPDLFLVDLMMPRMSGKEFIMRAHDIPHFKDIPIIVMSALNNTEALAGELKVSGILQKPLALDELFAMINRILQAAGGKVA